MQDSIKCKITCSGNGRPPLYQQGREGGCSNRLKTTIPPLFLLGMGSQLSIAFSSH